MSEVLSTSVDAAFDVSGQSLVLAAGVSLALVPLVLQLVRHKEAAARHRSYLHDLVQSETLTRPALHRRMQEAFPDTFTLSLEAFADGLDWDHRIALRMASLRTPDVLHVVYVGENPTLPPMPVGCRVVEEEGDDDEAGGSWPGTGAYVRMP